MTTVSLLIFDGDAMAKEIAKTLSDPSNLVPKWLIECAKTLTISESFVENIINVIIPIASTLAAFFFMFALFELAMSERFSPESFSKMFVKLAIGLFLISVSAELVRAGNAFGDWISSSISNMDWNELMNSAKTATEDYTGKQQTYTQAIESQIKELKWWQRGGLYMGLKGMSFIQVIATAFILTVIVSRQLELTIRGCFFPIPMSFIVTEGYNSGAIRYMKKYIAVVLQGPAFVFIMELTGTVYTGILMQFYKAADISIGSFFVSTLMPLILGPACVFGMVGTMKASQQLMNDVMGV